MNTTTEHGYILVYVGKGHHLADVQGRAYEHRLVMEKKLGRRLESGELVHHKDENPANNHPDNLEVSTRASHIKHHNPRQFRKYTRSETCGKGHVKDWVRPNGRLECGACARERDRLRPSRYVATGVKPGEHNREKTHCPSGHEYTPANTRFSKNKRVCRTCHRQQEEQRRKEVSLGIKKQSRKV